jgi:hypothetical protein
MIDHDRDRDQIVIVLLSTSVIEPVIKIKVRFSRLGKMRLKLIIDRSHVHQTFVGNYAPLNWET